MKKIHILSAVIILFFLIEIQSVHAQRDEWVNQVIIVNGGKFESTPPFADFVTVQKYNPDNHTVTVFDVIHTQSVQDVIIKDNFAYVAAQDSIIKYNIDTYERVAAVADSGLAKLYMFGNKVLVSKQYPIKRFFLEVLDENLSLIYRVQNISGECRGITSVGSTVYVAVDGGWTGTEGKLCIINSNNWQVVQEKNFGTDAVGINDLFQYDYKVYSVNKTPAGNPERGSMTVYNIPADTYDTYIYDVMIGETAGIKNNLLYLKMNEGLGSINVDSKQIVDTTVVPDPGSLFRRYILSAAVDHINDLFYINIGDRSTYGYGKIATFDGDSTGTYTEGINADAIAIDYRTPVGIDQSKTKEDFVNIFPNPVNDDLSMTFTGKENVKLIKVTDLTGRVILERTLNGNEKSLKLNFDQFPSGIYLASFITENGIRTRKFVKQ